MYAASCEHESLEPMSNAAAADSHADELLATTDEVDMDVGEDEPAPVPLPCPMCRVYV